MIRILLIDDDEEDQILFRALVKEIRGASFEVDWASSFEEGGAQLANGGFDVCFLDYRLGARNGIDLLREAIATGLRTPIILLTGFGEHETDVEAMRVGAADYLVKDEISAFQIEKVIRYAMHRAQHLEALREREESFRSLLDSIFEGVILHEQDGEIVAANLVARKLFSLEAEGPWPVRMPELFEGQGDFSAIPSDLPFPAFARGPKGKSIPLEVRVKPFLYRSRSLFLTAVRDISRQKELEAQVLLQDRLASVGLLASSLAHEIGNPLGIIRGRAEYISLLHDEDEPLKKSVGVILGQADRMAKLIRSLLNLSRGDLKAPTGEVSLNDIVAEVAEVMAGELKKANVELNVSLPSGLALKVRAEGGPLHQVLLNLLVNSLHAIQAKGGKERAISVTAKEESGLCILSVADTGEGIPAENLKNLFQPFFTTKDVGVGTGLGLATSYRIAQSWSGTIQVESVPGEGALFRLVLPKA